MNEHVCLIMSTLYELESLVEIGVKGIVFSVYGWNFEMPSNNRLGVVVCELLAY